MNIIIIILAIQIRLPCYLQRLVERNAQFHTVEMLNVTTLFENRIFLQRTKKKKLTKSDNLKLMFVTLLLAQGVICMHFFMYS